MLGFPMTLNIGSIKIALAGVARPWVPEGTFRNLPKQHSIIILFFNGTTILRFIHHTEAVCPSKVILNWRPAAVQSCVLACLGLARASATERETCRLSDFTFQLLW